MSAYRTDPRREVSCNKRLSQLPEPIGVYYDDIQIRGRAIRVPSVCIDARKVIITGKWLKVASVKDEYLLEDETAPELFVSRLRASGLKADIFTFAQKLPETAPKYPYLLEWDNAAVIPITSYSDWWQHRAEYDVRKAVKKATKLGVVVKQSEFNDAFVKGICGIYNESPVRQGIPFTHYQKDFDTVKCENSTYLERSTYIGAYYNDELIGFVRMVSVRTVATTLQVISQKRHFAKKPMNALIAAAVAICEAKGMSHLVYGSYVYNDPNSTLTEFKRRNGFEQIMLPRFYIPLTSKGKLALALNLHHRLAAHLPKPVIAQVRRIRGFLYRLRLPTEKGPL